MKTDEVQELDHLLQDLRGVLLGSRLEVRSASNPFLGEALSGAVTASSSEVSEQLMEKFLRMSYPGLNQLRHPLGERSFPDYRFGEDYIEFKSWRRGKGGRRSWVGPKFITLLKAIGARDDSYLNTVYIDCCFELEPNGLRLVELRAGRLWDFCDGRLSKKSAGVFLIPRRGNHSSTIEEFSEVLEESALRMGLDGLPKATALTELIRAVEEE